MGKAVERGTDRIMNSANRAFLGAEYNSNEHDGRSSLAAEGAERDMRVAEAVRSLGSQAVSRQASAPVISTHDLAIAEAIKESISSGSTIPERPAE